MVEEMKTYEASVDIFIPRDTLGEYFLRIPADIREIPEHKRLSHHIRYHSDDLRKLKITTLEGELILLNNTGFIIVPYEHDIYKSILENDVITYEKKHIKSEDVVLKSLRGKFYVKGKIYKKGEEDPLKRDKIMVISNIKELVIPVILPEENKWYRYPRTDKPDTIIMKPWGPLLRE